MKTRYVTKTCTETEYDEEDIENLHGMTKTDVMEMLKRIDRNYLPQDYLFPRDDGTYSESQYEATKLHMAIQKAIDMLGECKDE